MRTGYAENIHQLLAMYRFLAYGLAVILIQVIPGVDLRDLEMESVVLLSALGVYTVLKVFAPMRWEEESLATYIVLEGDLLVALFLILFTEGLDSGYLLYSLLPVITAALLFPERVALVVAALTALAPVLAHTALHQFSDRFAWVLDAHLLPLLLFYVALCFLIATIAYRTNLNIHRRIASEAIQDERRRMRRELHDGVAQSLNAINLQLSMTNSALEAQDLEKANQGVEQIRSTLHTTYADIRESIDQLNVEVMPGQLSQVLTDYTQDFSHQNSIPIEVSVSNSMRNLVPYAELHLLRIVQEALANVRKHATATHVQVTLDDTREGVELMVIDNGQGFIPGDRSNSGFSGHHGLAVMRERVEELGGILVIRSMPGEGTEVRVNLPKEKVRH